MKYLKVFETEALQNEFRAEEDYIQPHVSCLEDGSKVKYNIYSKEYYKKLNIPFTIEATEDGTTIYFRQSPCAVNDGLDPLMVEVSTDNGTTWTEVTASPAENDVPGTTLAELDEGDKILIRGRNEAYGFYSESEGGEAIENCNFLADKPCYIYGNIMSLIGGDDFARLREVKEDAFAYFFSDYDWTLDWSGVLSKEGEKLLLPATTLANSCYYYMFNNCTSLTTAPELPATTLVDYCYGGMFNNCTSLTTAPKLPTTTLANDCYSSMFNHCTSLTSAPALPATTLTNSCYQGMFANCTNLIVAPKLPATTLASYCYFGMFQGCTSLATAPELPATTLADSCYYNMFGGCTSLATAPELPATTLADSCYRSMFQGCTNITTIPELSATTLSSNCYQGMFKNCINLTTAPTLPATTLASYCYLGMFQGCTSLATAPELPSMILANYCYQEMFRDCINLTTAPTLPAVTLTDYCYNGMFYGCTKLSYIKAMFTTIPSASYTNNGVLSVKATGTFVKNSAATGVVSGVSGIPAGGTIETASS